MYFVISTAKGIYHWKLKYKNIIIILTFLGLLTLLHVCHNNPYSWHWFYALSTDRDRLVRCGAGIWTRILRLQSSVACAPRETQKQTSIRRDHVSNGSIFEKQWDPEELLARFHRRGDAWTELWRKNRTLLGQHFPHSSHKTWRPHWTPVVDWLHWWPQLTASLYLYPFLCSITL